MNTRNVHFGILTCIPSFWFGYVSRRVEGMMILPNLSSRKKGTNKGRGGGRTPYPSLSVVFLVTRLLYTPPEEGKYNVTQDSYVCFCFCVDGSSGVKGSLDTHVCVRVCCVRVYLSLISYIKRIGVLGPPPPPPKNKIPVPTNKTPRLDKNQTCAHGARFEERLRGVFSKHPFKNGSPHWRTHTLPRPLPILSEGIRGTIPKKMHVYPMVHCRVPLQDRKRVRPGAYERTRGTCGEEILYKDFFQLKKNLFDIYNMKTGFRWDIFQPQ